MLKNYLAKRHLVKNNTFIILHDILQVLSCQNLIIMLTGVPKKMATEDKA